MIFLFCIFALAFYEIRNKIEIYIYPVIALNKKLQANTMELQYHHIYIFIL